MYAKSLFGIKPPNQLRTMIYPLGDAGTGGGGASISASFSDEVIRSLRIIQQEYTAHLASRQYEDIPTDFARYLQLFMVVDKTVVRDKNLKTLFQITKDGLKGSLHVFDLQYRNVELTVQNAALRAQIQTILDRVNVRAVIESSGGLCATRTFTLAPLFSYYILVYGMPAQGQGFDEAKLAVLIPILENNGINPYG
jgi:hypothetical protein